MSKETRRELVDRVGSEIYEFQNAADAVDDAAATLLGLNPTDQRCLGALVVRGPMTAGRLADAAYLSAGAMTASIDRLERAGFVRRLRDEEDRRRVVVEATPAARERTWELYQPLSDAGAEILTAYSDAELSLIAGFLRGATELPLRHAEVLRRLAAPAGGGAAIVAAARDASARLKAAKLEMKSAAKDVKGEVKTQAKAIRDELMPRHAKRPRGR
ncbi:MAG: MarR family winged helix-turn-helix transcriptional regulator [Actinomycetota bacterium]